MPRLAKLRLIDCYPPPANVSFLGSLRQVEIQFDARKCQAYTMHQLTSFLSSCKVLEKVHLSFIKWDSATASPSYGVSSVQHAEIILDTCTPAANLAISKSIHFPNAFKLYFILIFVKEEVAIGPQESAEKQEALLREVLPRHPLLRSLSLHYYPDVHRIRKGPIELPILGLHALETLSLSFDSWQKLKFWDSLSDTGSFGLQLPRIRFLKIRQIKILTEWKWLRTWLNKFFAQLKKQGILDAFELFTILEVEGETDPSTLEGPIHDFIPLEKIRIAPLF